MPVDEKVIEKYFQQFKTIKINHFFIDILAEIFF